MGINFCTGKVFLTGNIVANVSLVAGIRIPFGDDWEIAWNREFSLLNIDRQEWDVPALKLRDGC